MLCFGAIRHCGETGSPPHDLRHAGVGFRGYQQVDEVVLLGRERQDQRRAMPSGVGYYMQAQAFWQIGVKNLKVQALAL